MRTQALLVLGLAAVLLACVTAERDAFRAAQQELEDCRRTHAGADACGPEKESLRRAGRRYEEAGRRHWQACATSDDGECARPPHPAAP
ncbi:MAG: hypothetical protein MJE66_23370 [Proteobacteria bacterium]|nr:hypothetical protein [Pseudomonadota bacterium]